MVEKRSLIATPSAGLNGPMVMWGHETVLWADPDRDLACVILTTRAWDGSGRDSGKVSNVVQSAIEEWRIR
jgi:hypothetical protein